MALADRKEREKGRGEEISSTLQRSCSSPEAMIMSPLTTSPIHKH